jgi:hypothetical protein
MAGLCGEEREAPDLQSRNRLVMGWLGWSESSYVDRVRRVDLYDCLLEKRRTRRAGNECD